MLNKQSVIDALKERQKIRAEENELRNLEEKRKLQRVIYNVENLHFPNVCSKIQTALDEVIKHYLVSGILRHVSVTHYYPDATLSYNHLRDNLTNYIAELGFKTYRILPTTSFEGLDGINVMIYMESLR